MKKKLAICGALVLMAMLGIGIASSVQAADLCSVEVSTYSATDAVYLSTTVAGTIYCKGMTLSNSGATAQEVTFYENATSTTAVTTKFTVTLPAVANHYRPFGDMSNPAQWFKLKNFTVRKSSTTTNVHLQLLY